MKKVVNFFTFLLSCLAIISCKKEGFKNQTALKSLYKIYKNGEIKECRLDGGLFYLAGLNVYDGGEVIYDGEGNKVGECNYAFGSVDPLCSQLTSCEVIYRVEDHISGEPAVDTYDLD